MGKNSKILRLINQINNISYKPIHYVNEFIEQAILAHNSLTEEEKTKAIILNSKDYDRDKICFNSGTRRICENCDQECLATLYCEYCVRNYLKVNFSNWFGNLQVILKELGSVESANRNWFEEAKSHLTISNKYIAIVQCVGLTQNPSIYNFTWKERIHIIYEIIQALGLIHKEKSIHRDLHSGNILYSQLNDSWRVSDLGFCGPADKPSTSIYGNLPYIAPEVINGRGYTFKSFKSDIYSIAILMWEISSGQLPFMNYKHDHNLAINIINGMRPKILPNIPSKYKSLMEQCWDANPLKRPNTYTLLKKIKEIKSYYQNNPNELLNKIFENLPEPKNATEEQKKAFYTSKLYDFSIPDNISNLGKSSKRYTSINYKDNKDNDKESPRSFKRLKLENVDLKSEREITQQRSNIDINDR
ncbi:kinase-like domain-containing protein [Rhizophagus irregularis DAOM 181602=DAOM 197198]|uniref:non-specific serine/threonine protein kinase n=1 Tax=Rhizophagus irregularis (strain DAOM 181602 / DAOM 197198 / MUCL 43194) TaxID=747089 RepID=A0A2P4PET0_RHIID|nr:kinase-like domain-containing protein [Rhizophagus irregularis DAOM 181602=DAOM 197198]POG63886.1 kinase-like domain-containing protein [Rhizophagus irregularis DAOM 181602=DAOM 197198]|eukprot:XP_025170752.1 kinase-like domain-containing protein [Rhizophagus irregularis DAOM 181602=DAOM 197198]